MKIAPENTSGKVGMDRKLIRNDSIRKMELIEEKFSNYVPPEVQQYYLLQFLIVNGIRSYIDGHGFYPLDKTECKDGKELCGFGPLSFFESDCIQYLAEILEEKERASNKPMQKHQLTVYRN